MIQGYNCQAVVDQKAQVIVACEVSDCAADAPHVQEMMTRVHNNLNVFPKKISMDAGYFSEKNVSYLEEEGIDAYIATGRLKHNDGGVSPPARGRIPKSATAKQRMKRKLITVAGRRTYARRKVIVEPAFGQIKNRGFRQFSMRGLQAADGEWTIACMSHNLLKLYRWENN